jgi:C-terminal processing protease CtpA/Prc
MCSLARLLILSALALTSVELPAQNSACINGQLVPYFGWDGTACTDCAMRGYYIEYRKEPLISSIRSDGPAAGQLKEHDMILAVNGIAITTPEAWHRLRDVKPGEMLRFTVRNDGATRDAIIRVAARCLPVPARPPAPRIIIVRRKRGSV